MPRPASDNPRTQHARVRLTPDELQRMERRAKAAGHPSVAAFVRARCLTDPPERRVRAAAVADTAKLTAATEPPARDPATAELAEQVRRAGVTVNQCARHLNEGRLLIPGMERELLDALAELRSYVRRARAL